MISHTASTIITFVQMLQQEEIWLRTQGTSKKPEQIGLLRSDRSELAEILAFGSRNVTPPDRARLAKVVEWIESECLSLELTAARDRVARLKFEIGKYHVSYQTLETEVRVLREAVEDGLKGRYFYYYPVAKADLVLQIHKTWGPILKAYNKTGWRDALAATDCYAMGQSTAAVFHLMRLAEYGLRALARERGVKLIKNKPLEWAQWHEVIEAIRASANTYITAKKKGPARLAAQEFYLGALGQFESFKDVYRNNVMHARTHYTDAQAETVLRQVRDFMLQLSTRINEDTSKAIIWRAR